MRRLTVLGLLLALLACTGAWAQEYRGNVFVSVKDEQGAAVAGAACTLSGRAYSRTETSDAAGKVRFTRLEPGAYDLVVKASGFATVTQKKIEVETFANLNFDVKMGKVQFTEEMVITAQTPVLDQRKMGSNTVMSQEEVAEIPTARDPWAVLTTVPGVTTDRVNVGGSESGQQADFLGKGDNGDNNTWVMDGVEFTDLGAIGASPTYFDFNTFEEVGAVTGGADVEQTAPGVRLQFTTKQGSNRLGGKVSVFFTNGSWQNAPASPTQPSWLTSGAGVPFPGNKIDQINEENVEVSGPFKADMAWFWVGWAQNNINLLRAQGPTNPNYTSDKTQLRNATVKFNGVAWKNFYWKLFYTDGNKTKQGRNLFALPADATATANQKGPTPMYTGDLSYFITPNFELSVQYSKIDGGFGFTPSADSSQVLLDSDATFKRTSYVYDTKRPTTVATLRGNVFAKSGPVDHEIKFGYRYRDADVKSFSQYGGDNVVASVYANYAYLYRIADRGVNQRYDNFWVGDTMLVGNWTINLGVNYQKQNGNHLAEQAAANPICPACLPAVTVPPANNVVTWENWLPRVGATYTFNTKKRGLIRGGYAEYADQLGAGVVSYNLPGYYSYIYYTWDYTTGNGDKFVDPGEFDPTSPAGWAGVDPNNPGSTSAYNQTSADLKAPRVREVVLGTDWEVMRDFAVGANLTYRKRDQELWYPFRDIVTGGEAAIPASAYTQVTTSGVSGTFLDTGAPYTVNTWQLNPAYAGLTDGSHVQRNRPGYDQEFQGIEVTATKRLSNKWMLRGYLSYSTWKQHFDGVAGISDPTNFVGGTTEDGGEVTSQSGGSGKNYIWVGGSKWQFNTNFLYQLPWDWNISANLYVREGYGITYFQRVSVAEAGTTGTSRKDTQIGKIGDRKYDSLYTLDLRAAKLLKFSGNTVVELAVDCFNCLNNDTILAYDRQANTFSGSNTYNRIRETLSPRVFRAGASVQF